MPRRILVVEDEALIADAIAARLRSEGLEVQVAGDGPTGVSFAERFEPDLVILDLMLPGLDGLEVCRQIQKDRHVPVLMLTARDTETDLEIGLAVGGDDYMVKPFSPRELVARVRALLRRADRSTMDKSERESERLRIGTLVIDPATREVLYADANVHLTPTEFDLLYRLALTPHVVYGRRRLLEQVWGYKEGAGERTVDSHVRSIRRKLDPSVIRTVHAI